MIESRPAFIPRTVPAASNWSFFTLNGNIFFTLGAGTLALAIALTASVFIYKEAMQRSRAKDIALVHEREQALRSNDAFEEIIDFSRSLTAAQNVLKSHVFPTSMLALLRESAHQSVRLQTISFHGLDSTVAVGGTARSYRVVAEQITAWEAHPDVAGVTFGGLASAERGFINFNAKITLRPSALRYRAP